MKIKHTDFTHFHTDFLSGRKRERDLFTKESFMAFRL